MKITEGQLKKVIRQTIRESFKEDVKKLKEGSSESSSWWDGLMGDDDEGFENQNTNRLFFILAIMILIYFLLKNK